MANTPTSRWPTLDIIWIAIVPISLLIILNLTLVQPNDFWWHLRTGQIIVSEGHIPTIDRFSFTRMGQPWSNQAWLMQAALFLEYRAGGLPLVLLCHALTIAAGYTILMFGINRYYGIRATAAATLIGMAMGANNWAVRPQSISFLAFGLLVYLIEGHRQGKKMRLWWVLPLFIVWVNSHGGFVFGIGVLGFYVVGRLWEFWRSGMPSEERKDTITLAAIGVLALAAIALNPQGPLGIVRYVMGFVQSSVTTKFNTEFLPLVIREWYGAFFFVSLLVLVIVMLQTGFRPRADQTLNLLVFITLALLAQRNLAWYGFVLIPILAAGFQKWSNRQRPSYPGIWGLNVVILLMLSLAVVITLPWWRKSLPIPPHRRELVIMTPATAMEFLCSTLPDNARVFQYQAFGTYQIWACPRLPVFIDTRIELFPPEQWKDYLAIESGLFNWASVADKYGVTHLFLSTSVQKLLIEAASASPHWEEIYRDDSAVIFRKRQDSGAT